MKQHWKRIAAVATVLTGLALAGPLTHASAEITQEVWRTDGVEGQWDGPTTNTVSSPVWDMQAIGNTIYVAGKFLNAVETRGSWTQTSQPFLAAFDATSGEWIDWWRPQLDAPVWDLDVLPNGSLLAAGEFDHVNGEAHGNLIALDPRTGRIDRSFNAQVERRWTTAQSVVRGVTVKDGVVYAIGNFSHVTGGPNNATVRVWKAARLNASNGTPDPNWKPVINGRSGWAVVPSTDNSMVFLAGQFDNVNGLPDSNLIDAVDAVTGASVPNWNGGPDWRLYAGWPTGGIAYDIGVYGNNLYVGGAEHMWQMRDARTGANIKVVPSTNDTQSVDVIGDRVYIGCHCDGRNRSSPGKQMRVIDGATGTELPMITTYLRSGDGGWGATMAPDGCLWIGGEFWGTTRLHGDPDTTRIKWVGNFARMCDANGPAPHNVPSLTRPPEVGSIIPRGATWRVLDANEHPAGWTENAFDDRAWPTGRAELGFGDGDEATTIPNAVGGQRIASVLFRNHFDIADPGAVPFLKLGLNVDDGATVWINGVPVVAENMPSGPIASDTLASTSVWGAAESDFSEYQIPSNMLRAGSNTIAVSVHQDWRGGGDLTFDAELAVGSGAPGSLTPRPSISVAPVGGPAGLVAPDAAWKYLDDGSNQGTAWRNPGFADGAWKSGSAQLGYGEGDEATVVSEGRDARGVRAMTTYFRRTFQVDNPAAINELVLGLLRDDGAVVYVNGQEVVRDNMPAGTIDYRTAAVDYVWGAAESAFNSFTIPRSVLVQGTNTIAVEVHQTDPGSADLSFALGLEAR